MTRVQLHKTKTKERRWIPDRVGDDGKRTGTQACPYKKRPLTLPSPTREERGEVRSPTHKQVEFLTGGPLSLFPA